MDGNERVWLLPHGRYHAVSTCDSCVDMVRVGELCRREAPQIMEDPGDCREAEATVVMVDVWEGE
jgi:hypothetical protein